MKRIINSNYFPIIGVLAVMLFLAVYVYADQYRPTGYQTLTVTGTAGGVGFTSTKYIDSAGKIVADHAIFRLETAQILFPYDGTIVSTTLGLVVNPMDFIELTGYDQISKFKGIATGGTSGSLKCLFEKLYKE